jgi:hypothetical protein
MPGDDRYTAYCGLYCKDCIPSDEKLFQAVEALEGILDDLQIEKYAALKAKKDPAFRDYGTFVRVLGSLKGLKCKNLCTEGGCKENCLIRDCVLARGFRGCWTCEKFEACELHEPLKLYHPGLAHNLRMIRQYGPDDWSEKRGRHYNWSR